MKLLTVNGQGDPEDGVINEEGEINNEHIVGKDKSDVPGQVLIGSSLKR